MSLREQNKQEKRTRILAAAEHIIAREGIEYLTMRYLAEVAGVSSRTPYNLFDSKTDILFAIMLERMEPIKDLGGRADEGLAVAVLLQRVETLLDLDTEREAFFRSIHWAIMRSDDMEAKIAGRVTINHLIANHVEKLLERGELKSDCDTQTLTGHLEILLASILGMWADSQLTLKEAVAHTRYAWINSLVPHARGKALKYLRENDGTNLLKRAHRTKEKVA